MGSIYIKHSVAVDMDTTFIHAPQILHLDVRIIVLGTHDRNVRHVWQGQYTVYVIGTRVQGMWWRPWCLARLLYCTLAHVPIYSKSGHIWSGSLHHYSQQDPGFNSRSVLPAQPTDIHPQSSCHTKLNSYSHSATNVPGLTMQKPTDDEYSLCEAGKYTQGICEVISHNNLALTISSRKMIAWILMSLLMTTAWITMKATRMRTTKVGRMWWCNWRLYT